MNQCGQGDQNQILIRGTVGDAPRLSHCSHDQRFYQFPLCSQRLSGNEDVVNVLVPGRLLQLGNGLTIGEEVEVEGSLRTFNNRSGVGSRLVITILARRIAPTQEEHLNQLRLTGTICRRGCVRRTPLGREICDFTLAVNRKYGHSDYLPCIAWGSMAQKCACLSVGSRIALEGRLQSRGYVKQFPDHSEERVAYEVSAMELETESEKKPVTSW